MNGDAREQTMLRRLRHELAAYRCDWEGGTTIVVGAEFFTAAAAQFAAILALPVGESLVIHGRPFDCDPFTVTRTR